MGKKKLVQIMQPVNNVLCSGIQIHSFVSKSIQQWLYYRWRQMVSSMLWLL